MSFSQRLTLASILGGLLAVVAAAGPAATLGADDLRVLVVTGGHGYDVPQFGEMFAAIEGIAVVHQDHPEALATITSPAGDDYDVVVLYDMTQPITDEQKEAYAGRFQGGTGLVILHHAIANFQEWPEYEEILGGRYFLAPTVRDGKEFARSQFQHDVDIPVRIAAADHFVTRGLEDFVIHDETYRGYVVAPSSLPLLETEEASSAPVIGWAKPYGKGRVVYLQLGHDRQAYANPSYRTLVSRAIRWTAHRTSEDAALRPLFNGRDLTGWKAEGNARFTVEDGILVGRQGPGGAAGDLFSEEQFGDFELVATWAMDWPGNSGIWFRYVDAGHAYQADVLEYQNPRCWAGSLYCSGKMFLAMNEDPTLVNKEGWNTFRIRARGDHVQLWLNGRQVADVHDDGPRRGRIGFQVHAGDQFTDMAIRLADLRIRSLDGEG